MFLHFVLHVQAEQNIDTVRCIGPNLSGELFDELDGKLEYFHWPANSPELNPLGKQ